MLKSDSGFPAGLKLKRRPWFEEIQRLKYLEKERAGLIQTSGDRRSRVYAFLVAYKMAHDGNSPGLTEIMGSCGLPDRMCASRMLNHLVDEGKIIRHGYKGIEVIGGTWTIPGAQNIIKGL